MGDDKTQRWDCVLFDMVVYLALFAASSSALRSAAVGGGSHEETRERTLWIEISAFVRKTAGSSG